MENTSQSWIDKIKSWLHTRECWLSLVIVGTGILSYIEWRRQNNRPPPPQGMFGGKPVVVHNEPIPVHRWPTNRMGQLLFQPTYDWQEVPDDCVLPPGMQVNMDVATGKKLARAVRR